MPFQSFNPTPKTMSETATLDNVQPAENPAIEPKSPRFNPITCSKQAAITAQAAAVAKRQHNKKAYLARIRALEEELAVKQPIIDAAMAKVAAVAVTDEEFYRLEQLARVRGKIETLWQQFEGAEGGKELQAISTAIQKLSDMEFALARRPKPAAYRTAPEKPKRSSGQSGPVDAD